MAISPDGRHVLVSASTANVVDVIDTKTGQIVARIPSGDQPHESNFSRDGKRVYHASIGSVYTPQDEPIFDLTKGKRVFEIIDATNWQVLKMIDMGKELDEFGQPDMSGAVRPMALAPDEKFVYFQVSFFHGFVEYDLQQEKVTRLANLPISDEAKSKPREEYLLAYRIAAHGHKPYWATNSKRGSYCFVSFSGDDAVSVVSYRKRAEIARIQVGDHPQRMRMGKVRAGWLGTKKPRAGR
jgi:YVTN family beta-propeller protein